MRNKEVISYVQKECVPNHRKNKKQVNVSYIYGEKQKFRQGFYTKEKIAFCFFGLFYA